MNKKYLKFLFKERRVVLIFFFILYIGIALTPNLNNLSGVSSLSETLIVAGIMSVILTYVLPVLLLAFIHQRKSADLYLALPISRKQQLVTILLFCFAVAFGYFLVTALASLIVTGTFGSLPKVLLIILLAAFIIAVMVLFNSALFLVANNSLDGIVMVCAYTGMPLIFMIALMSFIETMVAGASFNTFDGLNRIIMYTSPLAMNMSAFFSLTESLANTAAEKISALYVILPALYGAAACCLLKVHFISRPSERADQVSNDILAYPAAIHICLFLSLITLATALTQSSLRTVAIFFLLLLLVYITAMFVYKRSLKLEKKPFIIFTAMSLICILFCRAAWNTECFGLAENYDLHRLNTSQDLVYQYNRTFNTDTMNIGEKEAAADFDPLKYNYYSTVRFDLRIPAGKLDEYRESAAIMEQYRKKLIAEYYEKDTGEYSSPSYAYFSFCTSTRTGTSETTAHHYGYRSYDPLSEEDLLAISKITPVFVEEYDEETYDWAEFPLEEYLERRKK